MGDFLNFIYSSSQNANWMYLGNIRGGNMRYCIAARNKEYQILTFAERAASQYICLSI